MHMGATSQIILTSHYYLIITILLSSDTNPIGIEVAGDIEHGKPRTRSHYFVRIFVDGNKVAKSTRKSRSTAIKWEWDGKQKMCE